MQRVLASCLSTSNWESQDARLGLLCLFCSILVILLVPQEAIYKQAIPPPLLNLLFTHYILLYIYIYLQH